MTWAISRLVGDSGNGKMSGLDFVGLLAAPNNNGNFVVLKLLIFVGVTLLLTIFRKIAESREKAMRANQPKPPAAQAQPRKDNPFRNEIEAFLEEVGKRRAAGERLGRPVIGPGEVVLPKPVAPARLESVRKAVPLRPAAGSASDKSEAGKAVAFAPSSLARPGEEMAARKSPASQDLGKQIRDHLATYLDSSRMASQTQSDLGNAVERTVRQHLGQTITAGVTESTPTAGGASEAWDIVPLLRNPSSARAAIVVNEILGRPKGLRRRP
jgi:hypothetical protein